MEAFLAVMTPDSIDRYFFVVRGVIALVSTVAYLYHMNKVWRYIERRSQRMRYLTLLGWAILVTARSYGQAVNEATIEWYSLAAFGLTTLLLVTAIVSIRDQQAEFFHHCRSSAAEPGNEP